MLPYPVYYPPPHPILDPRTYFPNPQNQPIMMSPQHPYMMLSYSQYCQQYQRYYSQLNFPPVSLQQMPIVIPDEPVKFSEPIKIEDTPPLSLRKLSSNVKIEDEKHREPSVTTLPPLGNTLDDEDIASKTEDVFSVSSESIHCDLEGKIHMMLRNFVDHFESHDPQRFKCQREKYADDPVLTILFDQLTNKFSSASKCREDMIRVVMRKATQFLQKQIQDTSVKAKDLPKVFCKRYFAEEFEKHEKLDDEDAIQDMVNDLLPYKRGSSNKTVNSDSIKKLFASKNFAQDYEKHFLKNFLIIMDKDNQAKFKKFKEYLVESARENDIETLKKINLNSFKRIPWLKEWVFSAQDLARELNDPASNRRSKKPIYKKTKTDRV